MEIKKQKTVGNSRGTARRAPAKANTICRHDYKNAIQIGNVDYVCPLCKELLDPFEWFIMNSFEFVEVRNGKIEKKLNVFTFGNMPSKSMREKNIRSYLS